MGSFIKHLSNTALAFPHPKKHSHLTFRGWPHKLINSSDSDRILHYAELETGAKLSPKELSICQYLRTRAQEKIVPEIVVKFLIYLTRFSKSFVRIFSDVNWVGDVKCRIPGIYLNDKRTNFVKLRTLDIICQDENLDCLVTNFLAFANCLLLNSSKQKAKNRKFDIKLK